MDAVRHTYLHFVARPADSQARHRAAAAEAGAGGAAESAHGGRVQGRRRLAGHRVPDPRHRSAHSSRSQTAGARSGWPWCTGRGRRLRPDRILLRTAADLREGKRRPASTPSPSGCTTMDVDRERRSWPAKSIMRRGHARGDASGQTCIAIQGRTWRNANWSAAIPPARRNWRSEALQEREDPAPRLLRAGPGCHLSGNMAGSAGELPESAGQRQATPRYRPGVTFTWAAFWICRTSARPLWRSTRRR